MRVLSPTERGQAGLETAFVVPVLVAIVIFVGGVSVLTTAQTDLYTATSLAALGASTAPAENGDLSQLYAQAAWVGTIEHHSSLRAQSLECQVPAGPIARGGYEPGDDVTCTGVATVALSRTPVAVIWPFPDLQMRVTVKMATSTYRGA
ncbi:MAG TPA: hypothetical protein VG015_09130 [Candidatus Dormibacteraeota bacterium]|nr:hypothetical protein [Candidatus Dormibacteraeota bacterium]